MRAKAIEQAISMIVVEIFFNHKVIVHEIQEVLHPSGENVKIPINIRFVDPPSPRTEDLVSRFKSTEEFDSAFNTCLSRVQQLMNKARKPTSSKRTPSPFEIVELNSSIETLNLSSESDLETEREIFQEIKQRGSIEKATTQPSTSQTKF